MVVRRVLRSGWLVLVVVMLIWKARRMEGWRTGDQAKEEQEQEHAVRTRRRRTQGRLVTRQSWGIKYVRAFGPRAFVAIEEKLSWWW